MTDRPVFKLTETEALIIENLRKLQHAQPAWAKLPGLLLTSLQRLVKGDGEYNFGVDLNEYFRFGAMSGQAKLEEVSLRLLSSFHKHCAGELTEAELANYEDKAFADNIGFAMVVATVLAYYGPGSKSCIYPLCACGSSVCKTTTNKPLNKLDAELQFKRLLSSLYLLGAYGVAREGQKELTGVEIIDLAGPVIELTFTSQDSAERFTIDCEELLSPTAEPGKLAAALKLTS